MNKKLLCVAIAAAMLAACSKKQEAGEASASAVVAPQAQSASAAGSEHKAMPVAATPKADKSVPFSDYKKLTDGKQLMFAYYAASTAPVEYEKVAAILEPQKYVYEQDEFKRRDVLAALKPQIDAAVEKAKQSKYYKIAVGSSSDLDKYDFESKSFLCKSVPFDGATQFFTDGTNEYRFTFANGEAFRKFKIDNEELARKLESLRTKYNSFDVVAYFFAGDTKIGEKTISGELMKLQIVDKQGNVLAEQ